MSHSWGAPTDQSTTDASDELQRAVDAHREVTQLADAELLKAVQAARANAISWQAIGAAFGTSRQAVWERFSAKLLSD